MLCYINFIYMYINCMYTIYIIYKIYMYIIYLYVYYRYTFFNIFIGV